LPARRLRALRTICGSWSRRKGMLAAPANLAVTESHSWYFFGSCVATQAKPSSPRQGNRSINQSRDIRRQCRERRETEGTLRTGLEAVVAAAGGGPCRRRWWRRGAGWWYDAGTLDARGFRRRRARGAAALGETPARARRERAGDAGRSGRRRLGTDGDDMAGG